jgi:hypothetical protein
MCDTPKSSESGGDLTDKTRQRVGKNGHPFCIATGQPSAAARSDPAGISIVLQTGLSLMRRCLAPLMDHKLGFPIQ